MDFNDLTLKETILEKIWVEVYREIHPGYWLPNEPRVKVRELSREVEALVLQMDGWIWGQSPQRVEVKEIVVKWPDGWTEALKERLCEKWPFLLKWIEPRMHWHTEKVSLDLRVVYPELRVDMPQEKWRVVVGEWRRAGDGDSERRNGTC